MNLFEQSLTFKGFDMNRAKADLERIQAIPEVYFDEYIEEQKKYILTHHLMYNPFYRAFVDSTGPMEWEEVPVMGKTDLQQRLENRLVDGYRPKDVYVGKTSGSSGTPFIFAKCKLSHALSWASFYDRYAWYNIDLSSSKQARFYGIPLDFVGYQKERLKDRLSNRHRFPIFNLNDRKLERILTKFKTIPFEYINGYTSSIVLFGKFLKERNIILKTVCPSLKICITTSEMLFDDDRNLLEKWLGIPIINEYGASETGLIAFQNQEGDLQVDSELLYVEILDDDNRNVPLGTVGRIVVTSLYNKAHPIIRYEIGDMGALSTKSTPQKPILEKLQGRTSDIAQLPSGKVVPGLTFYYVTKTVIEKDGNVKEFVIEQTQEDTFVITYVSTKELLENEKDNIKKATATYLEKGLNIQFIRVPIFDRSKNGKLKQFSSGL